MKRKFVFMAAAAVLLAVSSCQEKIQTTTAKIKKMSDSTMVATIDKYDITFDMRHVRYDNGVIIPGDSAVIHYIGNLRDKKAKALLVRLVPKQGTVVEAVYDPSKELITDPNPMPDEQAKKLEKFARSGRH